ncbi:AP-1 complex subunit mu-2 [Pteropus alecto]|uniref:Small nuclear ribonucleoprotein E n=1 Tax=Pteropus alecto TaxID=9402 RepID=L5JVJ7_PTEAL|nr:AP-1 complex subunit mu-2 [Pteropus alecto]
MAVLRKLQENQRGDASRRSRIQVWLYEQVNMRIEGCIIGFDEYMNLVLDDAEEIHSKTKSRKQLAGGGGHLAPLLSHAQVHFLWIKHSNLYLVATTLKNANASLVYSFLYKTVEITNTKILQEHITQQGNKLETGKSWVPPAVTNAVPWRAESMKHQKNEVFINIMICRSAGQCQWQRPAE